MKNLIILLFLFAASSMSAQVKIGDNAETISPSSILELESSSKGLLITRLTTNQIKAIPSPARGLLVYNTDVELLQINTGSGTTSEWMSLTVSKGTDNKGAFLLPVGTDADRPISPVNGMLRYNTQSSKFEKFNNGSWTNLN